MGLFSLAPQLPLDYLQRANISEEALDLRDAYLKEGILSPRWTADASHVALATVSRADAVVSWNFKHIVKLDKIKAYNQVNLRLGYGILTILSPWEVIGHEKK